MDKRERKSISPFCIVLAGCILVVLGALRNIVTPLGYWLLWAAIASVGMIGVIDVCRRESVCKSVRDITIGFVLLLLGLIVAGLVNEDRYTLYQGMKFFCIYIVFLVVFINSRKLSVNDIVVISRISIIIAFSVFAVSKFVLTDLHVVLGDGREGSQYADPGVLWKSAVFFVGFILANSLVKRRLAVIDITVVFMAIYVLFADSSRTGFLLFILICTGLLTQVRGCTSFKISRDLLSLGILRILVVVCLVLFFNFSIFDRIFKVDSIRLQMLADGISNVRECYMFGCGFGSSSSMVFDKPMVVHNAYLAALADLGVLGFAGLLIVVLAPIFSYFISRARISHHHDRSIFCFVAMMGVAGYGLSMLLHSLSSELSEWGIWGLMVSWQMSLSSSNTDCLNREVVFE